MSVLSDRIHRLSNLAAQAAHDNYPAMNGRMANAVIDLIDTFDETEVQICVGEDL